MPKIILYKYFFMLLSPCKHIKNILNIFSKNIEKCLEK